MWRPRPRHVYAASSWSLSWDARHGAPLCPRYREASGFGRSRTSASMREEITAAVAAVIEYRQERQAESAGA